jgi:hypothetical protein
MPEDGHCPNCGASVSEITSAPLAFPPPPIGIYKDAAGYLEITKNCVIFCRKQLVTEHIRTIPFREIYGVSYAPGRPLQSGFLCVREWKDRNMPFPDKPLHAADDETAVYFRQEKNATFEKLYLFLNECAAIANPELRNPTTIYGKYKGGYGYLEIYPDCVVISKHCVMRVPTQQVIAYDEISEVAFRKADKWQCGALCILKKRGFKSMRYAMKHVLTDDTSIDFAEYQNEQMHRVYTFLMDQVRKTQQ